MALFRRPTVRYGRTPEPETRYQRAAQAWDERIGSARVQAKNWRLMAFGSLVLSIGLAGGLVWQSTHGSIVPWVVQVDKLGQAEAVAPAVADYTPSDPEVAWYLAHFIQMVRSLPADPIIVRQNWLQAYDFTTTSGSQALNDYARANDPFAQLGKQQIAIDVSSVIRASPSSFRVEWVEHRYEDGALADTSRWTAILTVAIRGERPRVTRLSRKVLISLGAVSALAIAGALGYALQTHNKGQSGQELLSTQDQPSAEGLAGLPKDYTGLPRQAPPLGPPLPGDLGKPILNAGTAPSTTGPASGPDPEAQRLAQETEAARVSRLFAQTDQQPQPVGVVGTAAPGTAAGPTPTPPVDAGAAQNMQDRKTAFLNASTDRRTVSDDRLQAKASPYVVQAGTVIPAALITGIRSDLPGQITAQVTEAVYDSPTGQYLLIPQGTKLIGQYDSSVAFGQSRVLLVWTRLIMPDGTSIVLERQPGADTEGYAGLEDQVDYHWWELAKAAVLSTFLSVGAEAGTSNNNGESNLADAIREGASNSVSQTGQQIVSRQLNIQPTLTIRPGFPVRVIVTRDLVLAPYGQDPAR